jgi:hypothetical protein
MPRDWRNDPLAIERHCSCPYMNAGHVEGEGPIVVLDGQPMTRTATDPNGKLHGRNPDHDLPESI